MNQNILPSDRVRVIGTIDPDAYTATTYTSDWVPMDEYNSLMALVMVGAMGSTGTVDAKLQQATDSSGTGAKDITGKSITQLTEAGSDSDKQAVVNLRGDELDVDNSFTHAALVLTVGTAASDVGAVLLGLDARYEPGTDLASVDEIVS